MKALLDQTYAERDGVTLRYDAFMPASAGPTAAIITIHGGGWVSGDRADYRDVAEAFASNGFAAFCPQYRLAPLYPFPAAVEDIRSFVSFLRSQAGALGIRDDAIGAFGNSAGGHLALMLGVSQDASQRVDAVVDVCGLTDLTNPEENHPPISWDFINQFMACPYKGNEPKWIEASPIYQITGETAPTLIFHGSVDDIVWKSQSEKLFDAMLGHGLHTQLIVLENEGHSFSAEAFDGILKRSYAFFTKTLAQMEAVS